MTALGCIGFGNMGEAMIQGIRKQFKDLPIYISDTYTEKLEQGARRYDCTSCGSDNAALVGKVDTIILAVKPGDADAVLSAIRPQTEGKSLISILAGKSIDFLSTRFGSHNIARCMPNLAAPYGKAVTGISFAPNASQEFRRDTGELLSCIGSFLEISESLMPAIIGISGSGIAFAFEFIHAMALGGTRAGISYKQSLKAVIDVVESAAITLRETGVHPEEMVSRVCSPAGTTIEGIRELEDGAFRSVVMNAVKRAADRSKELEA